MSRPYYRLKGNETHNFPGDEARVFVNIPDPAGGWSEVEDWLFSQGSEPVTWWEFFKGPIRDAKRYRAEKASVGHYAWSEGDDEHGWQQWSFGDPDLALLFKLTFGGRA